MKGVSVPSEDILTRSLAVYIWQGYLLVSNVLGVAGYQLKFEDYHSIVHIFLYFLSESIFYFLKKSYFAY